MTDLLDFRLRITKETDDWLDVMAAASGHDKQSVAREELHKIALIKTDEIILAYKRLKAKGMVRD